TPKGPGTVGCETLLVTSLPSPPNKESGRQFCAAAGRCELNNTADRANKPVIEVNFIIDFVSN
ncbi:MAG: hypothetical protein ACKO90_15015, partial [Microcystis panniformis]